MSSEINAKVKLLGFNEKEITKFTKIFQISRPDKRSYFVANESDAKDIDIVIVNTQSNSGNQQYQIFRDHNPDAAFVSAGTDQSPHHLIGMLLPSRVFKVLDDVNFTKTDTKTPPAPIDNNQNERRAATQTNSPGIPEAESTTDKIAAMKDTASPKNIAQTSNISAYQVLVVDDSELMQKAVQFELDKVDRVLNIDFSFSGEEALQRIKDKKYDVIFMDVMMPKPGMDGFEACTEIRKLPEMKKTPIIMLTAKTSPLDEVKGVVAGCTTYLTKPIKPDNFQNVMKRVLGWLEKFNKKNQSPLASENDNS